MKKYLLFIILLITQAFVPEMYAQIVNTSGTYIKGVSGVRVVAEGDLRNDGNFNFADSYIRLGGAAQDIKGAQTINFGHLIVHGNDHKTFLTNAHIHNNLSFNADNRLILNNNVDLLIKATTLPYFSNITDSLRFVVTDITSRLIVENVPRNTEFLFPVGDAIDSYKPILLEYDCTEDREFAVRVEDGIVPATDTAVLKTYRIMPSTPGLTGSLDLGWNVVDQGSAFIADYSMMWQKQSGVWEVVITGTMGHSYNAPATDKNYGAPGIEFSDGEEYAIMNCGGLAPGTILANQTICTGTAPAELIVDVPASGGSGSFDYYWQEQPGCTGSWLYITGATASTYQPDPLTQTTCFRRGVTSGQLGVCGSGYTNIVTITVEPNNTISLISGSNNQTICLSQSIQDIVYHTTGATGANVTGLPAGVSGTWVADVVTISGTPTETGTFNYTVTMTGGCTGGTNTATGTITVYTALLAGTVGTDQSIDYNTQPAQFTEITPPSGGSGSYTYQWQKDVGCTGNWANIPGATGPNYQETNNLTDTTCYRRIVMSYPCDPVFTNEIEVIVYPPLVPGEIAQDQTICENTLPSGLTEIAPPTGGTGFYTFQWQEQTGCSGPWVDIGGATASTYQPGILWQTTCFRRLEFSGGQSTHSNTIEIVVTPGTLPTFTQLGPYCVDDTPDPLPTISINGITGTWAPSVINTDTNAIGSTTYTFTPNPGECATTATMDVVVSDDADMPGGIIGDDEICEGMGIPLFVDFGFPPPPAPDEGTHVPTEDQIIWNWEPVSSSHLDCGTVNYKYNTTNNYSTATDIGSATSFTQTGLPHNTTYNLYVWAYNDCGQSPVSILTSATFTCGTSEVTFTYNGNQMTYGTVESAGQCWLDRNLGASQVATSSTDAAAYGDLFQWGRAADGHEVRSPAPGTTFTQSNSDTPGHGDFITPNTSPFDWRDNNNDNRWNANPQENNPCPSGWRVPTEAEWEAERQSWSTNNTAGAFASPLKLPVPGRRGSDGSLSLEGSSGDYWSSTVSSTGALRLYFNSSNADMFNMRRAHGLSVRCIMDDIPTDPCGGVSSVSDNDGNTYATVAIGNQCWFAENLATTKYRTGQAIEYPGTNNYAWENNTTGAYAWYNNDEANNKATYGALYNWHAATNGSKLCPPGWKVPTEAEFDTLLNFVGSTANEPYLALINNGSSGFDGLFGGWRYGNGYFNIVGSLGYWWSSSENGTYVAWTLRMHSSHQNAGMYSSSKEWGFSVRCLQDNSELSHLTISGNYEIAPGGSTTLTADCGPGTSCTYSWCTGATTAAITVNPSVTETYTVTATSGGDTESISVVVTVSYCAGVMPPSGYGIVSSSGNCWLDRNLGASQVATSSTDAAAYGDLYQWGRDADGHETRTPLSGTTSNLSNSDTPGHSDFILSANIPKDWRDPQNSNLWQGVSGTNNPCPAGWRVPTDAEWDAERLSWNTIDAAGAFHSPLKLPTAGMRTGSVGTLFNVNSNGYYWSNAVGGTGAKLLQFSTAGANEATRDRAYGVSVRCIFDDTGCNPPVAPTSQSATENVTQIVWQWNTVWGADGYKYNTTNDYTTATDVGTNTYYQQTGLSANTSYTLYVWAYNACGASPELMLTATTLGSSDPCDNASPYTDGGGTTYNPLSIGNQCWFDKNMNKDVSGSWHTGILGFYGRLYNWDAAEDVCPTGWRLPNDNDWKTLEKFLGMSATEANDVGWRGTNQGEMLKSDHDWYGGGHGSNTSGFNALPSGFRNMANKHVKQAEEALYWTATEDGTNNAWARKFHWNTNWNGHKIFRWPYSKVQAHSVRCIRDVVAPPSTTVFVWYKDSCGGTQVGTGTSITVFPDTTTTYYVRGESNCGVSDCVSHTVMVFEDGVYTSGGQWHGSQDSSWFTPQNWRCNVVPNPIIDAVIPDNSPRHPIVDDGGGTKSKTHAECKDLILGINNELTVNDGEKLHVYGDARISGDFKLDDKGELDIEGDFIIEDVGAFDAGEGIVSFIGTGTQSISRSDTLSFYDLRIDTEHDADKVVLDVKDTLIVRHQLILDKGGLKLNARKLIIDNPSPDAIPTSLGAKGSKGGHGYVLSETKSDTDPGAFELVQWNIGETVGTYTVPYGRDDSGTIEEIPLTLDIIANEMDDQDGFVRFSTYSTENNDNEPYPEVTGQPHIGHYLTSSSVYNNTYNRYWYVEPNKDAGAYIEGRITMTYIDDENPYGQVSPAAMMAVRYNPTPDGGGFYGSWIDVIYTLDATAYMPIVGGGILDQVNKTFTTGYISRSNFFNVWLLTNYGTPLPISLLYFNADCNDGAVDISWATATEINNDYFTVERSADGVIWSKVGIVQGAGTSSTQNNYSLTDNNPFNGLSYYRLKQTDYDGSSETFSPVVVNCNGLHLGASVVVYPNPFNNHINIAFSNITSDEISVVLYDAIGSVVYTEKISDIENNSGIITLNISNVAKGIYFIEFVSGDTIEHVKIIKE